MRQRVKEKACHKWTKLEEAVLLLARVSMRFLQCSCYQSALLTQDVVEVLITMGALEAGTLRVLPLGLVARNIQVR